MATTSIQLYCGITSLDKRSRDEVCAGPGIALPFSEVIWPLPSDIACITVDEAKGHYLTFKHDGTLYGKYPVDDEQRLVTGCAVNIKSIVTNQDDHSGFAEFKGPMVANIRTSYAGSCNTPTFLLNI
ncbi:uncharacterized protein BT62DRAFT_923451 [Guyanagaster necrorhizus]|uniref:Uncharacterized protein n=1 Tax=Guyanagaster necrorhizus TaxID=856835 RepID=A0A9P7VIG8_9AGAR|nr:uncharacterized protein BT62DRAFT_923451 [Guyanagaster necrorhizus MCA 3950]KAG7441227.1 hypothetical protein BT62DRAFT_923451 [Guyanagaster necrorhizus MCA 3950]